MLNRRHWHLHSHKRAAHGGTQEVDRAADKRRAFAHRDDAQAAPAMCGADALAVILDIELQQAAVEAKAHSRLFHTGMTPDVAQRLLQDTVDLNADLAAHVDGRRRPLIRYRDAELPLHGRKIP